MQECAIDDGHPHRYFCRFRDLQPRRHSHHHGYRGYAAWERKDAYWDRSRLNRLKHSVQQRAVSSGIGLVRDHNKTGGYMCTSCAWAKPAKPHGAEFCENGAKATFWDLTSKRTTPAFFDRHTVTELLGWSDYDLEHEGRLTHPVRYDMASDRYLPVSWEEAFAGISRRAPSSCLLVVTHSALPQGRAQLLFGDWAETSSPSLPRLPRPLAALSFPRQTRHGTFASLCHCPSNPGGGNGTVLFQDPGSGRRTTA
jgi:hypothetical protein